MMRPTPRHRALAFVVTALLIVVSCLGDPTGPSARTGGLALAPRYEHAMAAAIVDVSAVRVQLNRPGLPALVVDTVIHFPVDSDTIELRLEIPLERSSEEFEMRLAMTNAQGDTVFRAGPILVTAAAGNNNAPAEPTFTYVGVGANAAGVRFIEPPSAVPFGETVTLAAEAFDGQQNAIAGTPIGFELVNLADSVRGRITDARAGTFEARTQRGDVQVRAVLASGQSATHTIAVQPVASGLVVVSGNGQSGPAGSPLGAPLVARVVAADALGVDGIEVDWHVVQGGDTLDVQRTTSDANGLVSYALTLSEAAGAHAVSAEIVGNEASRIAFTATSVPSAASRLEFITQPPGVIQAAQPFTPALQVAIMDAQGNVIPTATDVVTLELVLGEPVGGGALHGATSVAAVAGIATFTGLAVGPRGSDYELHATSGALTPAVSDQFDVAVGPAVALEFETQPPAGAVFGSPFTVRVQTRDAGGNEIQIGDDVTIALGANPGDATLGGTLTRSMSEHVVVFDDLTLDALGTGYTLVVSAPGLPDATSNAFDVTEPPEVNAWTNPAGGAWSNAANWSRGTVPSVNDTVWIKLPGDYTVTIDQATSVGRVEIGGVSGIQRLDVTSTVTMSDTVVVLGTAQFHLLDGGLAGTGGMRVQSHFGWEGGNLTMAGTIRVSGSMAIAGTATRTFTATVIELSGLGLWANIHQINSGLGATWRVLPGGNVDVQGAASWLQNQGGSALLDVQGGLLRTTSAGTVVVPALAVSGTMTVMAGTLETRGTATSTGTLGAMAGATLAFGAGAHTLAAGSVVEGEGNVAMLVNSNVVADGGWLVEGTTTVNGAFDYNGASGQSARLELFTGRLGGSGELAVTEHLEWEAGNISGGGGTTRVLPGATVQIAGNTARTFANHVLSIGGTGSWSGGQNINSGLGAVLRIEPTGDLDIDGTPTLVSNQGGATTTQVQGLLRKSTPGTASLHGLAVSGELQLSAGTIVATGTGTSTGTITIDDPGFLLFTGGTQTLAAASSVTGDGWVQVGDGATVDVAGTWGLDGITQVTNGIFAFNGSGHAGTLMVDGNGSRRGTGTLLVNTLLHWNSGAFSTDAGVTRVQPGANLLISGTSNRVFTAQTIEVAGTAQWTGNHTILTGDGAVLRVLPTGSFAITGTGLMGFNQGGTQSIVDVQGTMTRTTSAGLAAVVGLNVSGSLSVESGVLELRNDGTSSGALAVSNGAELRFAGGAHALTPTSSVSGAGLVSMTSGTVTSDGAWTVGGTTRITNGTLLHAGVANGTGLLDVVGPGTFGGSGTMSVTGGMTWTGGVIEGGAGTLRVEPGATFASSGTGARVLRGGHILDIAGGGVIAGNHSLLTGQGALIRVDVGGTLDIQGDLTVGNNQGAPQAQFVNAGTITRSTSAGMSTILARFVNEGALNLTSGMLRLSGGGSLDGSIATAGTGTLSLNGGSYEFLNGLTATGTGDILLDGGTVTSQAGATAAIQRLRLNGGVFSPAGLVSVAERLLWDGAAQIEGGGHTRVEPGAMLDITNGTTRVLRDGATLENAGTATWTGDAQIFTGTGARLVNAAGATFNWAGNGDLVDNQGAPQATFVNEGSFEFNGDGIAGVGAFVIDTVGTQFRIENTDGEMQLAGGGRFGGPGDKYTGGDLVVTGAGTVSLQGGSQWTADGGYLRVGGGTLTLDSAGTASITALELRSGTVSHEGTLDVTAEFLWSGGVLRSTAPVGSPTDLGGVTTFGSGANVQVTGTAPKTLLGNHRFVNPVGNVVQFGGSGNLVVGQGVVFENLGTWEFDGTAQVLHNQGGSARFINPSGATIIAGATTPAHLVIPLENSGGHLHAAGDTLVLGLGSVNAFTGSAEATGGYAVRLGGGTFTQTGPLTFTGDLHLETGSLLDLAAQTATVGGDLHVTGLLRITQPTAVMSVLGDASFINNQTPDLTAGRLDVAGSFTQSGTGAFRATAGHVTRMVGTGHQVISFEDDGVGQSWFGSLTIANSAPTDSVVLASDARLTGSVSVQQGRLGKVAPHRLVAAGDASVIPGPVGLGLRPFVLEVGNLLPNGTASITPDTLVLNRTGAYTWTNVPTGVVHQRFVGGPVTFSAPTAPGDVIVDGTTQMIFPAGARTITGNLETRFNSVISQMVATSDVTVLGDAIFGGGTPLSVLTAGRLAVHGDFSTVLAQFTAAPFVASGTHVTVLAGNANSTVSFATPSSFFDSLVVAKAQSPRSTVTLLTDVRVTGGMTARDGSDIVGPNARLSITGGTLATVLSTASPTIQNLRALELSAAPTQVGSLISPDTVVFNAGVTALPIFPALQYRSIRVNTGGPVTFTNDTIAGDLDIANGTAAFVSTANFRVNGNLTTRNNGALMMISNDANLTVAGDARFLGGSTAGALNNGVLTLLGSFEQSGNASSFQATGNHRTYFKGSTIQSVSFATPDTLAAGSRFARVGLFRDGAPTQLSLLSPAYAGEVSDTSFGVADVISSPVNAVFSIGRADFSTTTFDGARLALTSPMASHFVFGLTFQNQDPTLSQLYVQRAEAFGQVFNSVQFLGPVPTTGFYVDMLQIGAIQSAGLTFNNSAPGTLSGRYRLQSTDPLGLGQPFITWNGGAP